MDGRDIFIGDIHGCWDEFQALLDEVGATDADRVISVGDLVDRGPDSVRLWEYFRDRPHAEVLMGNHERKHVRGVLSFSQEIVKLQFAEQYEAFRSWAADRPYFLETDDVIAVHGGFEDGVALHEQREDVLSATTSGTKYLERLYGDRYWPDVYSGRKPIVFGHHVVGDEAVVYQDRVFGIDTGACHGGFLTALVVPGFTLHRVPASRDHWRAAQKKWTVPVLRARPWASYKWKKLARELEELARRSAQVQGFARELQTWVAKLDAQIPALIERVHVRRRALEAQFEDKALKRAIAAEPHANLLFSSHTGSLRPDTIRTQLTTPAELQSALETYVT